MYVDQKSRISKTFLKFEYLYIKEKIKDLTKFIATTIRVFLNERYKVNNLPENIILLSKGLSDDYGKFLLYDINSKKPIGYISFGIYPKIGSFTVGGVYSERGYGAFLYESAMTYIYPNALSMSRDSTTSGDALKVWFKFKERNDVKKERMYSDEITHKKEDWIEGGF